jgi:hypothetical protein
MLIISDSKLNKLNLLCQKIILKNEKSFTSIDFASFYKRLF